MNLAKRACLYLVRKKGKTATLLAFLLVMATLMLTCLSIQSATETANANIKKALMGYFTINAKQLQTGITEDTLNQILSIDGLSGNYTLGAADKILDYADRPSFCLYSSGLSPPREILIRFSRYQTI